MSDAVDRGITVTELLPMDQPINGCRETTAAFIGRALRGPLNEPVLVHSFGEFRRRFGDIWSRSSLGPAVQQFFDHGGRSLYIVRVANNARGAMICLPACGSAMVLRALEPGSTECIRAAVDLDGIDAENEDLFNLTLQRIDPDSGLVLDQEIYRHISYRDDSGNSVADRLLTSSLARVGHSLPRHRPEVTHGRDAPFDSAYVQHAQDGTDGQELSDYDLVGSRKSETGLFALQQIVQLDLLYLPPPGKGRDLGPTSVLAAERFCRERGAMLIVDPRIEWATPTDAIAGIRELGYASPNMVGYFPYMRPRYDEATPARAIGAAVAGLMCKLDRTHGAWQDLAQQGLGLSRELVPILAVDDDSAQTLVREGLNVVTAGPAGSSLLVGSVTMARGCETHREFASLPIRRLCLQVINAIDQATRWAVFEPVDSRLAATICSQVTAYLSGLADAGAFANAHFSVQCESGPQKRGDRTDNSVTILIAFQPVGSKEPVSFTLHQTVAGCRAARTAFAPVELH